MFFMKFMHLINILTELAFISPKIKSINTQLFPDNVYEVV